MKRLKQPTSESVLDKFHYKDGKLFRKRDAAQGRYKKGERAGSVTSSGYRSTTVGGAYHYEHRLIWIMHNGQIPDGFEIDHINRDRIDNRLENLRLVDRKGNAHNRGFNKNNSTGYKGVSFHKAIKKYHAQINWGKVVSLGYFNDPKEAHEAYLNAVREKREALA